MDFPISNTWALVPLNGIRKIPSQIARLVGLISHSWTKMSEFWDSVTTISSSRCQFYHHLGLSFPSPMGFHIPTQRNQCQHMQVWTKKKKRSWLLPRRNKCAMIRVSKWKQMCYNIECKLATCPFSMYVVHLRRF